MEENYQLLVAPEISDKMLATQTPNYFKRGLQSQSGAGCLRLGYRQPYRLKSNSLFRFFIFKCRSLSKLQPKTTLVIQRRFLKRHFKLAKQDPCKVTLNFALTHAGLS